jgi:predicted nucleic acid-binding protein
VRNLGFVDTNIIIHALRRGNPLAPPCQSILDGLEDGTYHGILDVFVVYEALHLLERLGFMPDRPTRAAYLRAIITLPSVTVPDQAAVLIALERWEHSDVSFVDAWLWARARATRNPVCTTNRKHFDGVRLSLEL